MGTRDTTHARRTDYRRDIDGLRAIAVLAVVVHHLAPALLRAGFIGVDVFFVISGFLITRIVYEEGTQHRFSYLEFYRRRCLRILPALTVVLAACLVIGALVMTGPEFESLGKHVLSASLFASNIVLWREAGYFDTVSIYKPLLHLWSLAIEEQFYLVWPTLVVMGLARPMLARRALVALFLVSLLTSISFGWLEPSAGFYLLPARFWELLAGGAVAFVLASPGRTASDAAPQAQPRWSRQALSVSGFALLIAAFALIDQSRPYPGAWALLPVLGTAAIIAAGEGAWLNRLLLRSPVAVWIGLRSYPWYLWHWPLLSFVRIVAHDLDVPARTQLLLEGLVIAVSLLLADLTYRYVELPFQRRARATARTRPASLRTLGGFLTPILTVGLLGGFVIALRGVPSRYTTAVVDERTVLDEASRGQLYRRREEWRPCEDERAQRPRLCVVSQPRPPEVAVLGDSHAEVLYPGLADSLPGTSVMLSWLQGCSPLVGTEAIRGIANARCLATNRIILARVSESPSIRTVVLASRGPYFATRNAGRPGAAPRSARDRERRGDSAQAARRMAFERGLLQTVEALTAAGKLVILVIDVPELGFHATDCVLGRPSGIRPPRSPCAVDRRKLDQRTVEYRAVLGRVASTRHGVRVFDATRSFCDQTQCRAMVNGRLLYSDDEHLSLLGSATVAAPLAAVINEMLRVVANGRT